jgi:hypothetical protein
MSEKFSLEKRVEILEAWKQIVCEKENEKLMETARLDSAAELQAQKESTWNPDAIKWVEAEGTHGKYERSEDVNSLDFKALMKDLEAHQGKLSKDGYFFWKFEKSAVIGRKLKQKTK